MSFFFFFKHFMTFSGNPGQQQYVQTNLKSQQIHTDVGTKAFQFIILKQSQREKSNAILGFVWFVTIWNAVAAFPEVEPE